MQVTDEKVEKAKAELFKAGMVDVFSVRAALTAALSDKQAVEVSCIACEGRPSAGNNPCAVCGRSALVDVPAVEPVAWLDDGSCRAGSDRTAYRVVTSDQKRDMPAAIAASFTTPLYAHPPLPREGEDSAEVDGLTKALMAAYEEFNRIACEFVTETRSASDALDRCHVFANRGASSIRAALAATRSDSTTTVGSIKLGSNSASATEPKGCAE